MPIKTQDIARDGLHGYLAQPETAGKGSVLIMPTIFGVNPFVRGYADTLARAGLTAAVCDFYSGEPLPAIRVAARRAGRADQGLRRRLSVDR
jgi:dienelactone hydrolase